MSTDPPGSEHVVDFLLPGKPMGLDGPSTQWHTCTAVALETVCY